MHDESVENKPRRVMLGVAIHAAGAGIFLLFAYVVYGNVFANGLCCVDDSQFAVVAKNLAMGMGYANSVPDNGNPGLAYFDPSISTGPTLIMPAAALIRLRGNVPWAPGLVTATSTLSLMLLLFLVLCQIVGSSRAMIYLATVIVFLYSITAGTHFELWYALLGETPAASLCVAGALLWASSPDRRSIVVLSCLLYGLALATKMLALLSFVPIAGVLIVRALFAKQMRRARAWDLVAGGSALVLPFILFEMWTLSVLGVSAYWANLHDFFKFFAVQGGMQHRDGGANLFATLPQRWSAASRIMSDRFGFSPMALLVSGSAVASLVCCFAKRACVRNLCAVLLIGGSVHLTWWICMSLRWPRYMVIGLFLYVCAFACIVLIEVHPMIKAAVLALLLLRFSCGYEKFVHEIHMYDYQYSKRVGNLLETVAFLERHQEDRPFVGGWWGTVSDLEYAMPTANNFLRMDHVTAEEAERRLLLVRNEHWVDSAASPAFREWFKEWEDRCSEVVFEAAPYLVTECPPGIVWGRCDVP